MSISSVGTSVSYAPALEFSGTRMRSAEQRAAAVSQITASLSGTKGQADPKISRAAADIERVSRTFNKKLQFVVDPQSHEVIVKVIDKTTDKVIKVLPPEELQRMHRKLKETIGFLFNERV